MRKAAAAGLVHGAASGGWRRGPGAGPWTAPPGRGRDQAPDLCQAPLARGLGDWWWSGPEWGVLENGGYAPGEVAAGLVKAL